ncbi:hypothetical protein CHAB381_1317 [Campylobacter hominis ATCC BAA-381]|uniref:Uncharacterized protein n=1 Tax=Campylobacter hominis (strain ATCC BAA-381 / DSM 21671 / CCUG 45161 / LMG 19568 / NCTC 13146 / CH001A) TaxID=360107 RepID=A7I2X6_CAMHC|nr:hypothetical protein CHAB381_1317 [Campylobacter hominis ATCC BAA-381]
MKRKFAVFYFLHRLLKISPFLILSVKTAFGIVPYDVYYMLIIFKHQNLY